MYNPAEHLSASPELERLKDGRSEVQRWSDFFGPVKRLMIRVKSLLVR